MYQRCGQFTPLVCFPRGRFRRHQVSLTIAALLVVPVFSAGQVAYVTDYPGQHILAVSEGKATTVVALSRDLGAPRQVRVGGDNLLYVITSNAHIVRLTESGTNLQVVFSPGESGPVDLTGIRFDFAGNLYVNTRSGVFVIPGVVKPTFQTWFESPKQLTIASCSPAGDQAFTAAGNLLIACQGSEGTASERCLNVPQRRSPPTAHPRRCRMFPVRCWDWQ
jgi:streptogramin lyase